MAVPSSGELSLGKIYNEVDVDDYNGINSEPTNLTLKGLEIGNYETINTSSSSYPDGSAPYAMSEWYDYDHDASSSPSGTDYWDDTIWFDNYLKTRYDSMYDSSYGVGSGTTVTNIGTQSQTGTLINMTEASNWTQRVSLTSPGYWTFNGTDERITATPPTTDLFANNGSAFVVWCNPINASGSNSGEVMSIGDSNGKYLFKLGYNRGRMYCYHYHGSTSTKTDIPGGDVNGTDAWQGIFLSFWKQGNTYKNWIATNTGANDDGLTYVDTYETTNAPATLTGTKTLSLGARYDGGNHWAGKISCAYYFNYYFTPDSQGNVDAKTTAVFNNMYPEHGF